MNDLIQIIQVLTPEEVKFVNIELDKKQFISNSVGFTSDSGRSRVDFKVRSSSGCILKDDDEVAKVIHEGMNKALLEYCKRVVSIHPSFDGYPLPGGYMTSSSRELIQVLEYVKDQKYIYHTDCSTQPDSLEYHRKISIILYLSNDFEGGTTEFIHKSYKPSIGHALIFPANWCFPHTGTVVTKGKKRVAVTWYHTKDLNVK